MVKISHECPWSLMKKAREEYNDYDYCLVHLLEEKKQYMDFFVESKKMGRRILLDNSIFELGTAFDPDRFASWIEWLKPDEYFMPDVLEDCNATIANAEDWFVHYSKLPGKKIGVVQGKTYSELVECYRFMSKMADKIAISFDYDYYKTTGLGHNEWQKCASGRQHFIFRLLAEEIWNYEKPHHLLGVAVPQEFKFYSKFWSSANIETLDTSNPIQQAMLGHKYTEDGLISKDTTKVADSFKARYNKEQLKRIELNVKMFRQFCKEEVDGFNFY